MINRILYILLFLFTINCFSQAIVVDETTYTVPELVSKVLVNSSCLQATNIQWSTGTNYGAGNGIGYFETTNPDFPIKKGVILSTGNIKNAPGPNTTIQSDGNSSWLGDTDLENTIVASTGVPLVSTNATVLEFDFVPISSNFNFDFLFASEEYGNSQCFFSDAFAYLLTNTVTGITTNLAVVPSTSDPISVSTIRNDAFNSSCSSVNENFFDNYYGGALAAGAATNFEGNTKLMTASAILTPDIKYHIKLVIADRLNSGFDSAIFLSSQTFTFGADVLGPDRTIANGKAICIGDFSPDLATNLNPLFYTFVWRKGTTILPETGPTLTGITGGKYSVTYTNVKNNCLPYTDEILIETYPAVKASNPLDIYKCNTGQPTYDYDLSSNTPIMLVGSGSPLTPISISYHISAADANNKGANPLPNLYNSPDNVTIYARIVNQTTGCHIVKTFKLLTSLGTNATKPNDLTECSLTGIASFNLATNNTMILNGQSPILNIISFHSSQNDADIPQNPLPNNYLSSGGTVYVRVENRDDPTCYSTTSFELFVLLVQPLDVLPAVFVCDSYVLPPLINGFYFGGTKGTGVQYSAGDIIKIDPAKPLVNVITIYIFDPLSPCIPLKENTLIITFVDIPLITPKNQIVCDNVGFTLPGLAYGNYYTLPNGAGEKFPNGETIKTPRTIYTYFQSPTDPTCVTNGSFTVDTIVSPILPEFTNAFDCLSYKLPPLSVGNYYDSPGGTEFLPGTLITSEQTIYVEAKSNTTTICKDTKSFKVFIGTFPQPTDGRFCTKYKLPDLPIGNYYDGPNGSQGSASIIPFGTEITVTTSLYIYVPADANSNCSSYDKMITITIELPPLSNPNDVSKAYCGSYTLLPLVNGDYYTGSGGTGKLSAGDDIKTTQTIYIYITDGNICKNEISFKITINPLAKVDNRASLDFCGGVNYILTPMSTGSVGNYYTESLGGGRKLIAGEAITKTQTIYIYGTTTTVPSCPVENYFTLTFTPRVDVSADIRVCENYTLPVLTEGKYYKQPNGVDQSLNPGDVIDTNQTIYIYNEYPNRNGVCIDQSSFTVTITRPVINNTIPTNKIYCDEDGINDASILIDLTTLKEDILLGQPTGDTYDVTYYNTEIDAINGKNPITTVTTQDVYYKINNVLSPNCFSKVNKIAITINKIPIPDPNEGLICENTSNTVVINSGLPTNGNIFEWYNIDATTLMPLETGNEITVSTPDIYAVKVTNTLTTCSSQRIAVTVVRSSPPVDVNFTTSEAFDENQIVTVLDPGGSGDYEYQLDNGPFQDSPVFEKIRPGDHKITIRDKNGCGVLDKSFTVINYVKYFTPNSDGYNDTWNIIGLKDQVNAEISIFDRHGKLLKVISPAGNGWDGTYNGRPLPSSDYWFKVVYQDELGVEKEFKAHFSLKR